MMLQTHRSLTLGVIALSFALVTASVAEAQEEGQGRGDGQRRQSQGQRGGGFPSGGFGGPGGGADKINLVGIQQIRAELKISEEQQFFIDELRAEHREKSREVFSGIDFTGFRDKPEDERRKVMEEINAKRQKIVKQNEEVLAEFLTDTQNKRLSEITLQIRGTRALADAGVAKQLDLSAEQTQKIQAALKAADDERRKIIEGLRGGAGRGRRPEGGGERPEGGERRPPGGGFDFNAMREKMEAARKKTDESVLAVLSSEQKKKYEGMKGAAFTLNRGAFGRGRGGEGGGRRREGEGGDGGGRREGEGDRPRRPAAE